MREIKPLSFTYEIPNALAPDICREMIRRFEQNTDQQCGMTGRRYSAFRTPNSALGR